MKESKNKIATLKKCKGYVIIEMFDTERKKSFPSGSYYIIFLKSLYIFIHRHHDGALREGFVYIVNFYLLEHFEKTIRNILISL